ncbi:hypothetical protein NP493_335g04013 [Ridgeia piscesae]|uniref:Uncharacterized protein n=1 Tax=Ridgeia piscesae TaxID=27915 RepID=A0AAD9L5D9_RIDPI|nr:hypothetical protein NP493_335g04013 [Ridgeia piscesae]
MLNIFHSILQVVFTKELLDGYSYCFYSYYRMSQLSKPCHLDSFPTHWEKNFVCLATITKQKLNVVYKHRVSVGRVPRGLPLIVHALPVVNALVYNVCFTGHIRHGLYCWTTDTCRGRQQSETSELQVRQIPTEADNTVRHLNYRSDRYLQRQTTE